VGGYGRPHAIKETAKDFLCVHDGCVTDGRRKNKELGDE
jgi:hypothetical protein